MPTLKSKHIGSLLGLLFFAFLTTPLFADNIEGRLLNLEGQLQEARQQRGDQNAELAKAIAKLDRLEAELRLVTGNYEAQTMISQKNETGINRRYQDLDLRLAAIESQIELMDQTLSRAIKQIAPKLEKEREAFQKGLNQLKESHFSEAVKTFTEFNKIYPKSPMVSETHFWIGEAHYGSNNFPQAIKDFQKYATANPQGDHIPPALLKQGLSFLSLDMKKEGRLFLEKLIKEHPKTLEGEQAQRHLNQLDGKPEVPVQEPQQNIPTPVETPIPTTAAEGTPTTALITEEAIQPTPLITESEIQATSLPAPEEKIEAPSTKTDNGGDSF